MKIFEENSQILQLNEMFINVKDSLPTEIESSVYYGKLKTLLHSEIIGFCKEQTELKQDLNVFRMNVGKVMSETEIRDYLDSLKLKYNSTVDNVGLDYHIEPTRLDFAVPVFVVIKRGDIHMKKFTFRFRKSSQFEVLQGLNVSGFPLDALKKRGE